MGKIKVGVGAILLILAVIMTERSDVFVLYGLCAILHEIGHLIAAKRRNIGIKEIRLDVSGARICTEEGAGSYADEFILSASGPFVNILVIAAGTAVFTCRKMSIESIVRALDDFAAARPESYDGALAFFMLCAVLQGGLNLLPIKTFDGGRMLYCLCAVTVGQKAAECVIRVSGTMCMLIIWTAALYLMLKLDVGLSIYTFAACIFLGTLRDRELIE